MDINKESKIIVKAIDKTIKEFKKYNNLEKYRTEAVLQFRLYHHICDRFCKEFDRNSYKRISGECSLFETKNLDHYASTIKKERKNLPYMQRIYNQKKYDINNNIQPKTKKKELAKAIVKQGKYDIIIFNEQCTKIKHVIEVKKLKESYVFPEGVERHRGLEDIYELSDFIQPKKFKENTKNKDIFKHDFSNIHKECRGYNLMFICEYWTRPLSEQNKKKYEKMKMFLDDIKKAYEEAKIYYLAIGIDEVIIKNPNGISPKFEDLRCGEGTKYSTIS